MKISKLFAGAIIMGLFFLAVAPASAQTNVRKKEIKKVLKTLPDDAETTVVNYANSKLKDKEEGIAITDAKTLKKHFSLLSPTDQADVLTYAKNMSEGNNTVAMAPPKPTPAPAKVATTPQPVKLKPAPSNAVNVKPSPAANTPAQPGYIVKANEMPKTTVQWYQDVHDFGDIKQGDVATHTFKFKNTGTNDLLLTRVKASCGCTTPEWSNEAIKPGEEGMIKVSFNSRGKMGPQTKTVVVTHNAEQINHVLRFKGKVIAKPAGNE